MQKILLTLMLFTSFNVLNAAQPKPTQITKIAALEGMQKVYSANKGFSAEFEQKIFNKIMRREDTSSGKLFFIKPNKIRWEYNKPRTKYFIINGKMLWIYQTEDKQVMINECFKEDLLSASLSFLINPVHLHKDFNVLELPGTPTESTLRLSPKKPHAVIGEMVLILDAKSFRIKKSIIKDRQGNINQFTFSQQNLKASPPQKMFSFVAPQGVSVSQIGNCKTRPISG